MPYLQTKHLTLVPYTADLMRLTLEDRAQLAARVDARVPDDWPLPDLREALPWLLGQRRGQPVGVEWDWLIIHTADRIVIGDIGFKGGPAPDGATEIGYSVIPSYRGQGLAGEAATAMIEWALQQPAVRSIVAECLADNGPSIRVLEKLGMRQVGREGDLLRWALPRGRANE